MNLGDVSAIAGSSPAGALSAASAAAPVGPGASIGNIAEFEAALSRVTAGASPAPASTSTSTSQALRALMSPLDQMDRKAESIASKAAQYVSGADMSPGDIVMMTVRCQEFMFQCQLTSNAANRVSDGLQQLFRQQG